MSGDNALAASYEVTIGGGQPLKQTSEDGLQMLVVEDHVDMVTMATIRVGVKYQPVNYKIGDPVEVKIEKKPLFSGEITSLEPGYQMEGTSTITVRAMDKTHRLGRGRKTRFWENKKDSDVASEVGGESGLSVETDPTEDTHAYILQRNESNIAFLKRLAARNNFQLRVEDGKLLFKKGSFQGSSTKITMGENLRNMRMSFNTSDQVQKVVVRGWDITKKQEIVGTASAGDVTSIGGGQIGAQASSMFGESTAYITDVPVASQAMANQIAKAEMERFARQFCHGSCSVKGDSSIKAGSMVEFAGLPSGQNGKFYVMATRHIISVRTGYTTEITFCSNTLGS